jgi:sugar lactone lactonase YvrE
VAFVLCCPLAAEDYTISTLAGGERGVDGPAASATFEGPFAVAVDGAGNVYVLDGNVIRKISASGLVTTVAGANEQSMFMIRTAFFGGLVTVDGVGSEARFAFAQDIAIGPSGNLYVADQFGPTVRKVTPEGVVTTYAGAPGKAGYVDGVGSVVRFNRPTAVTVDKSENVYVMDASALRKITPAGVVSTLAGLPSNYGHADGTGPDAQFRGSYAISVDAAGNVFVADSQSHTIRKVTPAGVVTTLAGLDQTTGTADGNGAAARFSDPEGIVADGSGNVYIADSGNHAIRKLTAANDVTTFAGLAGTSGFVDGAGNAARFNVPYGMALDSAGNFYVADCANRAVRKITPGGVVTTLAGSSSVVPLNSPFGVAADAAGNVYVADRQNHVIRKIVPGGTMTTLAGELGVPGNSDGAGSAAHFSEPAGVTVAGDGFIYVADALNHTIRKISSAGVVATFAGQAGTAGWLDAPVGTNARFCWPSGLVADAANNLYVADTANERIRMITPGGAVTTLAGNGTPGSTDGLGAAAQFSHPEGITFDGTNLYVADTLNFVVRKVTLAGNVTTVAGKAGFSGFSAGTGSAARFNFPEGVAADAAGNVYVADGGNCLLRKITPAGVVSTLAGQGNDSGFVDGVGSVARFDYPTGIAVVGTSIYIADKYNNAIRLGTPAIADAAIIDLASGIVGEVRQLDTAPQTATAWQWRLLRAPSGSSAVLSSASARNPTFTPDMPDLYRFELVATGPSGRSLTTLELNVRPAFTSAANALGVVDVPFSFNVTVTNAPASFAATGLPPGLSIDAATGLIFGTPTAIGDYPVTVNAVSAGFPLTQTLAIRIMTAAASQPPVMKKGKFTLAFGKEQNDSLAVTLDVTGYFSSTKDVAFQNGILTVTIAGMVFTGNVTRNSQVKSDMLQVALKSKGAVMTVRVRQAFLQSALAPLGAVKSTTATLAVPFAVSYTKGGNPLYLYNGTVTWAYKANTLMGHGTFKP